MSDAATETATRSHHEIQKLLRDEIADLKTTLDQRFADIGALTEQLQTIAANAETTAQSQLELEQKLEYLQKRHAIELRLVHMLYASWRDGPAHGIPAFDQQVGVLVTCDLFDPEWYKQANPDIAESGMSPQEHYVRSGAFEGRNPGPNFDTMSYYIANRDVADAGWPALVHYAMFGQAEGRPTA